MSEAPSLALAAERLSRSRARLSILLSLVLVLMQVLFLVDADRFGARNPSWMLWSGFILFAMAVRGSLHTPRAARALMNDEVTRANSDRAVRLGFVVALATGIALNGVELVWPGTFSALQVTQFIVTAGLAAGLMQFGLLERRALG